MQMADPPSDASDARVRGGRQLMRFLVFYGFYDAVVEITTTMAKRKG